MLPSTQLLIVFAGSVFFVFCVWIISQRAPKAAQTSEQKTLQSAQSKFLFRAGTLVDANPAALQLCAETPSDLFDWSAMHERLSPIFPDFPKIQGASQNRELTVLHSEEQSDLSVLTIDQWDDVARVTIKKDATYDLAKRTAIMQAMFQAPNPIWKSDSNGNVVWRNSAYKTLLSNLGYPDTRAPIFDVKELVPGEPAVRLSVHDATQQKTRWFDITAVSTARHIMCYATEADAVVSALDTQRSFVQNFSTTFAHLSTGLVIFNRERLLILFNPAILELTGLPAEFLSKKCSAKSFFDQLREQRITPDNPTHKSWAKQVDGITQAALEGRYLETWTLPTGATYRVTGRPHPDGALVFLFEDITAEITVTRRFRTELDKFHRVLDAVETSLVLFSSTGQFQLCNDAYRRLWKTDPESSFAKYTLRDAIALWQENCTNTEIWSQVQERVLSASLREFWQATVSLKTQRTLRLSLTPILGGMTLISFDEMSSGISRRPKGKNANQNA